MGKTCRVTGLSHIRSRGVFVRAGIHDPFDEAVDRVDREFHTFTPIE